MVTEFIETSTETRRGFTALETARRSISFFEALVHVWTAPRMQEGKMAWLRVYRFWITQARGNRRPLRAGCQLERYPVREEVSLPLSGSPGLKRFQVQQGKPLRMALARHQFPWVLPLRSVRRLRMKRRWFGKNCSRLKYGLPK